MTFSANSFLTESLHKRKAQNALRLLGTNNQLIDFCSNDYIGFARSEILHKAIEKECGLLNTPSNGSGGSRLLTGNTSYAEIVEKKIAHFHHTEVGLIYNSGYDANIGLFSALGQKESTIIYDELIHASVHDGIRLSRASSYPFKHNDLEHLETRLKIASSITYVAVESIYSMDGDTAPLTEIAALCEKYNANLIVDEAHATGVTPNKGKGLVQLLNIETKVFARIHTFGKALGCHGAIVIGSNLLRDFLINFSRSFIYTTALPLKSLIAINEAYQLLEHSERLINTLNENIIYFKNCISENKQIPLIKSNSPIQCIIVNGNEEVKALSTLLLKNKFDVRPILSPTVPKGVERLRICVHAYNTTAEINNLVRCISEAF